MVFNKYEIGKSFKISFSEIENKLNVSEIENILKDFDNHYNCLYVVENMEILKKLINFFESYNILLSVSFDISDIILTFENVVFYVSENVFYFTFSENPNKFYRTY